MALLHPSDITAKKHHAYHHDLPGDPDLENPEDRDDEESYEDLDDYVVHEEANGFRKDREACNHNFECISGKCVSFMGRHSICMPF